MCATGSHISRQSTSSNPRMLLFLRRLVETVSSMVNDNTRLEYGHEVIKLAKQDLESDGQLHTSLDNCTLSTYLSRESENRLFNEFSMKVFHARVNEYMVATEEIEMEKTGKAV